MKTDHGSIIGCYCPTRIEDTTYLKDHQSSEGYKEIVGAKPFLFYFLDNKKLEIIKF